MRNRDLAVEYVDPTGKNVMEYILSLNEEERISYIDYIKKRTVNNFSIFLISQLFYLQLFFLLPSPE